MLPNKVKMVIWDLDDTYWSGTLSEGGVTFIDENREIVTTLAKRGIISSIVSKNDHATAEEQLKRHGVWDYFVFPTIAFEPKGKAIAELIENANLRAENVLFIDDNVLNLNEAKHYCPALMTADPKDILPSILTLSELEGKNDAALTRLQQYKRLETKSVEQKSSNLSNEEFLRQCDIRVEIIYNIDSDFDRIVELANRTNQLNFTKARLETPESVKQFREACGTYGNSVGMVRVSDRYGDYGMVGYFLLRRPNAKANELLHFAFSCRIMNMGVEQYVYNQLGSPNINIIGPVSNPIKSFNSVDWIRDGSSASSSDASSDKHLLLLGACDLLQLASMCGSRRSEFVNTVRKGWTVRFDDPGFILGDRSKIKSDPALKRIVCWTADDAKQFDAALASSEVVITSLFNSTAWTWFETRKGVRLRLPPRNVKRLLKTNGCWFVQNFLFLPLTLDERFKLVEQALDYMASKGPYVHHFALGANTRLFAKQTELISLPEEPDDEDKPAFGQQTARREYNKFLKNYCDRRSGFVYVDTDSIVDKNDIAVPEPEERFYPDHFTRKGMVALAEFIKSRMNTPSRLAS